MLQTLGLFDGTIRVVLASKNNSDQRKYQPIVNLSVEIINASIASANMCKVYSRSAPKKKLTPLARIEMYVRRGLSSAID